MGCWRWGAAVLMGLCAVSARADELTFGVIGDYGGAEATEAAVAERVKSWAPAFILTTGDNDYSGGNVDLTVGQYYHDYIYGYPGVYGAGSATRRFFPSWGNHDFYSERGLATMLDFFDLPGNERYYRFTRGAAEFFAINSAGDVDGMTADSVQGQWLKNALAESTATWKIVYFHEPPYSSGRYHGSDEGMRWPFDAWGADAVLSGHEHHYERLQAGRLPYFVNGAGGYSLYPFADTPLPESRFRYNASYGAQRGTVSETTLRFAFVTPAGTVVDDHMTVAGAVQFDGEAGGDDSGRLAMRIKGGAVVRFAATQHLSDLRIEGKAILAGEGQTLVAQRLWIDEGARLDLGDGTLIVPPGGAGFPAVYEALWQWIAQARAKGWAGSGIASSAAAWDTLNTTGLAIVVNDAALGPSVWDQIGEVPEAGSIIVKFTWNGDLNLSGWVDADDFHRMDAGFLEKRPGYAGGDLDYNGRVDADDYFLFDSALLRQNRVIGGEPPLALLPEPGIGCLGMALVMSLTRRRR